MLRTLGLFTLGAVGLAMMGLRRDPLSITEDLIALAGAAIMIGAWMAGTSIVAIGTAGARHNRREIAELEQRLGDMETAALRHKAGETRLAMDQPGKARPHLERAVELDGTDTSAWYLLGQACFALGDHKAAWKAFDLVYRRNREHDYGEVRLWAARTFLALDEPEHALVLADEFLAGNRGHLIAMFLRARALQTLGRHEAGAEWQTFLHECEAAPAFKQKQMAAEIAEARKRLAGRK